MWSTSTLTELNAKKPKKAEKVNRHNTWSEKTYTQMDRNERLDLIGYVLMDHGLQDTLKSFIKGMTTLMKKRGKSIEGLCVLEGLKGLLSGYLRRYEPEDDEEE